MATFNWNYDPSDFNSEILAEGDYRVRITGATPTVAKNGTEGLEITFAVNGCNNNLRHYIWFNANNVQHTNQLLGQFFNSFDIGPNDQHDCAPWIRREGAVHVVHSEYKGRTIAKVAFCISREMQAKLPAWREPVGTRGYENSKYEQPFTNTPTMPNEYVQTAPPQRPLVLDGFKF